MDILYTIGGFIVILAATYFVANPYAFVPESKAKKNKVGPSYWGVYPGETTEDPDNMKTIAVPTDGGKEKTIAGSATYSMGRGTSFRM